MKRPPGLLIDSSLTITESCLSLPSRFRGGVRRGIMSPEVASSPPQSKRLTLSRITGRSAGLALAFAFLPTSLSVSLAVAVLGILRALEGMRPPLVTSGGGVRRWIPWVIWSLCYTACPAAIAMVGALYKHNGPPDYDRFATRVVDGLGFAQLGVSVIASIAVVVLTRGSYRWLAWAAVLAIARVYRCAAPRRRDENNGRLLIAGWADRRPQRNGACISSRRLDGRPSVRHQSRSPMTGCCT